MNELPETTRTLLDLSREFGETKRVEILPGKITFIPRKTRRTSQRIIDAGIGDLVQRFVTHSLSKSVAHHFRLGSYDITGNEPKILK